MIKRRRITQLTLILVGLLLIISTYFLYPQIKEKEFSKKEPLKDKVFEMDDATINTFENVKYKGLYNLDKPFIVESETARILKGDSDIVYMNKMKVTLYTKDGKTIIITSNKGNYNKGSYDCFFEENVRADDGGTIILSENLDLLASEDSALVYNDVVLTNDSGSLVADKINYNFETKRYDISMFSNKKVKVKLIK